MPEESSSRLEKPEARAWRLTTWIAGVFSCFVAAAMLIGFLNSSALDPLKSPEMKEQKDKLRDNPADEAAKQRIRQLDLQIRNRYFSRLTQRSTGVYLLLGGMGLFVVAVTRYRAMHRQPPMPAARTDAAERHRKAAAQGRWSVAVSGAAIGAFLFVLTLGFTTGLPRRSEDVEKMLGGGTAAEAPTNEVFSADDFKRNWPRFRGPDGGGVAVCTDVPETWDATTGKGIAWKVPSPAPGFGSPVVWNDRVYFSGGDAAARTVFCLDLKTGQIVWQQAVANVPGTPAQPPEIPDSTGYAAATMATDGQRVYVIFANGDLAAFTLDGRPVWSKGFGALKNAYGHATSLATWRTRVILQLDQGEPEDGKSRLYALDGRTGQVVWQKARKAGASWATPLVAEIGGKGVIVVLSIPLAMAYSADDGAELWRAECLNGEITPSPIYAAGFVLVPSPSEKLVAIRPDGQGDVTKTHVAWTAEDNVPDVTSPCSNGELVFAVTTGGMLTCYEAATGKKIWEHDLEQEFHASPVLAGKRLYLFSQKGLAVVVEAAREYKQISRTEMPDAFHASPAVIQDRIVMRGVTNVWCIGGTK